MAHRPRLLTVVGVLLVTHVVLQLGQLQPIGVVGVGGSSSPEPSSWSVSHTLHVSESASPIYHDNMMELEGSVSVSSPHVSPRWINQAEYERTITPEEKERDIELVEEAVVQLAGLYARDRQKSLVPSLFEIGSRLASHSASNVHLDTTLDSFAIESDEDQEAEPGQVETEEPTGETEESSGEEQQPGEQQTEEATGEEQPGEDAAQPPASEEGESQDPPQEEGDAPASADGGEEQSSTAEGDAQTDASPSSDEGGEPATEVPSVVKSLSATTASGIKCKFGLNSKGSCKQKKRVSRCRDPRTNMLIPCPGQEKKVTKRCRNPRTNMLGPCPVKPPKAPKPPKRTKSPKTSDEPESPKPRKPSKRSGKEENPLSSKKAKSDTPSKKTPANKRCRNSKTGRFESCDKQVSGEDDNTPTTTSKQRCRNAKTGRFESCKKQAESSESNTSNNSSTRKAKKNKDANDGTGAETPRPVKKNGRADKKRVKTDDPSSTESKPPGSGSGESKKKKKGRDNSSGAQPARKKKSGEEAKPAEKTKKSADRKGKDKPSKSQPKSKDKGAKPKKKGGNGDGGKTKTDKKNKTGKGKGKGKGKNKSPTGKAKDKAGKIGGSILDKAGEHMEAELWKQLEKFCKEVGIAPINCNKEVLTTPRYKAFAKKEWEFKGYTLGDDPDNLRDDKDLSCGVNVLKTQFSAEARAQAALLGAEAEAKFNAQFDLLKARCKTKAFNTGLGDLTVQACAEAVAQIKVAGDVKAVIDTDQLTVSGNVEAKAEAAASICARVESKEWGCAVEATAKGQAGAGVHANAELSMNRKTRKVKMSADAGGTLGLGGSAGAEVTCDFGQVGLKLLKVFGVDFDKLSNREKAMLVALGDKAFELGFEKAVKMVRAMQNAKKFVEETTHKVKAGVAKIKEWGKKAGQKVDAVVNKVKDAGKKIDDEIDRIAKKAGVVLDDVEKGAKELARKVKAKKDAAERWMKEQVKKKREQAAELARKADAAVRETAARAEAKLREEAAKAAQWTRDQEAKVREAAARAAQYAQEKIDAAKNYAKDKAGKAVGWVKSLWGSKSFTELSTEMYETDELESTSYPSMSAEEESFFMPDHHSFVQLYQTHEVDAELDLEAEWHRNVRSPTDAAIFIDIISHPPVGETDTFLELEARLALVEVFVRHFDMQLDTLIERQEHDSHLALIQYEREELDVKRKLARHRENKTKHETVLEP